MTPCVRNLDAGVGCDPSSDTGERCVQREAHTRCHAHVIGTLAVLCTSLLTIATENAAPAAAAAHHKRRPVTKWTPQVPGLVSRRAAEGRAAGGALLLTGTNHIHARRASKAAPTNRQVLLHTHSLRSQHSGPEWETIAAAHTPRSKPSQDRGIFFSSVTFDFFSPLRTLHEICRVQRE